MSSETLGSLVRGADGYWRFRGVRIRSTVERAWADSLAYGVGVYVPGPATIGSAPHLECWRHHDLGSSR